MADKDDVVDEQEEKKTTDKHNWGAADLEKVTDHQEEKDDAKLSSDALGKLINASQQQQQKIVTIKKEDLQMIMNELELPKTIVERKLIEFNGDCQATMRSLLGMV